MRKIHYSIWIIIAIIALFSMLSNSHAATPQFKRVCHDVVIKGKKVQQCKNIRIHQKFKGTPIPVNPAKK